METDILETRQSQLQAQYPGVEFDENGEPKGKSIVEICDELERKFVDFYGEYGRRLVNERRERWNREGTWHFDLF